MGQVGRKIDAFEVQISPPEGLIGDDLSDGQLDQLWELLAGDSSKSGETGLWWREHPDQIAYRLLLRLTRAEELLYERKTNGI